MSNACFSLVRGFGLAPWRPCHGLASLAKGPRASCHLSSGTSPFKRISTIAGAAWASSPLKQPNTNLAKTTDRRTFSSNPIHQKSKRRQPATRAPLPETNAVNFPFDTISPQELSSIFGREVDQDDGNIALRTLHERRVVGSLVEQGVEVDKLKAQIPRDSLLDALKWLRENYPVDEQAAAQAWAAKEAKELEDKYLADAQRWGLYKETPEDESPSRTGTSVLDEWRRFNEEKRAAKEKEREESGEAQREEQVALVQAEQEEERKALRSKEKADRKSYYEKLAYVNQGQAVPDRTAFARLWPSTAFAVVTVALLILIAGLYRPPPKSWRLFPEVPTAVLTLGSITAINIVVCIMWRKRQLWRYMNVLFLQIPAFPQPVSLLLNIFSHRTWRHLAVNMVGLWVFGLPVHEDIGRGNFLLVYLAGGTIGSLTSLWFHVLMQRWHTFSCGASGALFALMAIHAYLTFQKQPWKEDDQESQEERKKTVSGIPRYYADFVLISIFLMQIPAHFAGGGIRTILSMDSIDSFAHLGGVLSGFGFGYRLTEQAERQKKQAEQREKLANMTDEELLAEQLATYERKAAAIRREENAKRTTTHKASFVRRAD